jgi:ribose transport system substrate-binding protein
VEFRSLRRKRALLALIVFACTVSVALSACGGSSSSSSSSDSSGSSSSSEGSEEGSTASGGGGTEGLKVGLFMTGSSNSYQTTITKTVEEKAKEYGMDLTVLQSNFEPQEQINQMQLAQQRESFDYWIVVADSGEEECGPIKSAVKAGIPVYLLVTHVCNDEEFGALGFVGVQGQEAYEEWFEFMLSENEPGEMALLTGPQEVDLTGYTEAALEEAQKKYPGWDVVATVNTDYTTGGAYKAAQDILQAHPNIELIASNYAGMTGGVVQAVKAAGKTGQVKIYDLLGDKIIKKDIENGSVTATLPGLPASESAYAVESIAKAAEGEEVEKTYNPLVQVKIKDGPFVTKANVAEFEPEY